MKFSTLRNRGSLSSFSPMQMLFHTRQQRSKLAERRLVSRSFRRSAAPCAESAGAPSAGTCSPAVAAGSITGGDGVSAVAASASGPAFASRPQRLRTYSASACLCSSKAVS